MLMAGEPGAMTRSHALGLWAAARESGPWMTLRSKPPGSRMKVALTKRRAFVQQLVCCGFRRSRSEPKPQRAGLRGTQGLRTMPHLGPMKPSLTVFI